MKQDRFFITVASLLVLFGVCIAMESPNGSISKIKILRIDSTTLSSYFIFHAKRQDIGDTIKLFSERKKEILDCDNFLKIDSIYILHLDTLYYLKFNDVNFPYRFRGFALDGHILIKPNEVIYKSSDVSNQCLLKR